MIDYNVNTYIHKLLVPLPIFSEIIDWPNFLFSVKAIRYHGTLPFYYMIVNNPWWEENDDDCKTFF